MPLDVHVLVGGLQFYGDCLSSIYLSIFFVRPELGAR